MPVIRGGREGVRIFFLSVSEYIPVCVPRIGTHSISKREETITRGQNGWGNYDGLMVNSRHAILYRTLKAPIKIHRTPQRPSVYAKPLGNVPA